MGCSRVGFRALRYWYIEMVVTCVGDFVGFGLVFGCMFVVVCCFVV